MKLEERTKANEARRGTEAHQQQQHYEASLDMGPTSASPRGRGHGLTLTLGVYVADVERDSVADGVIAIAVEYAVDAICGLKDQSRSRY